jgi:lipoprotein-anchoring transpeptidase ErfK/SrfK
MAKLNRTISRREFLKLGGLALGSLAFSNDFPPGMWEYEPAKLGRVTYHSISVFNAPEVNARQVAYRFRDTLLNLYEELIMDSGPIYNPRWYRVWGGYVHSAYVQPVAVRLNAAQESIPAGGLLTELSVPFSQPYNFTSEDGWQLNEGFYLYYQSTHWATDVVQGPDGFPWYEITDELWSGFRYYVPAAHLRPCAPEDLAPISPDVARDQKWIEVDLTRQWLTAYEGSAEVFGTRISSGVNRSVSAGQLATKTPQGRHYIYSKMPSKHMGQTRLADDLDDPSLPGVPWTSFFAEGGYAFHGAYWHQNYGAPMSRGCINMRPEDARWLFRWTSPVWDPLGVADESDWEARGQGTRVEVVV